LSLNGRAYNGRKPMPGQCLPCTPRRRFHQPVDQILSSRPHKYSGIGNLKHRASEEYRSEVCDAVDLAQGFQIHFHVLRHPAALAEKRNAAEVGRNSVCIPDSPNSFQGRVELTSAVETLSG
jgi:hypothetical protein